MAVQRLEKRLEAAGDDAAHDGSFDLDCANSRRALDLLTGGPADKGDFDSLIQVFCSHAPERTQHGSRCHPSNH